MTSKSWRRMIRKMRKYVAQGKTFNRFWNDHRGYHSARSTMYKAWKVAEVQTIGKVRSQDLFIKIDKVNNTEKINLRGEAI